MQQKYLTSKQAAEYLGYSDYTLRYARQTGMLAGVAAPKFIRLGSRGVRYQIEDLDAWVSGFKTIQNTSMEI